LGIGKSAIVYFLGFDDERTLGRVLGAFSKGGRVNGNVIRVIIVGG
jgi:hypothetical protein